MTLALRAAFFTHPVGIAVLLGLVAVGMAVSIPMVGYGALTEPNTRLLLALAGPIYNTFAASVTTGTIPANVITGALTCYLNSAATTPGNQTTRTATTLYNDLLAEFGLAALPT